MKMTENKLIVIACFIIIVFSLAHFGQHLFTKTNLTLNNYIPPCNRVCCEEETKWELICLPDTRMSDEEYGEIVSKIWKPPHTCPVDTVPNSCLSGITSGYTTDILSKTRNPGWAGLGGGARGSVAHDSICYTNGDLDCRHKLYDKAGSQ